MLESRRVSRSGAPAQGVVELSQSRSQCVPLRTQGVLFFQQRRLFLQRLTIRLEASFENAMPQGVERE